MDIDFQNDLYDIIDQEDRIRMNSLMKKLEWDKWGNEEYRNEVLKTLGNMLRYETIIEFMDKDGKFYFCTSLDNLCDTDVRVEAEKYQDDLWCPLSFCPSFGNRYIIPSVN